MIVESFTATNKLDEGYKVEKDNKYRTKFIQIFQAQHAAAAHPGGVGRGRVEPPQPFDGIIPTKPKSRYNYIRPKRERSLSNEYRRNCK
jgi:hypothetical protein